MANLYLDGDPASDSTRRQLERLLRQEAEPRRPRRWGWLAFLTAGGTWALWRMSRRMARRSLPRTSTTLSQPPAAGARAAGSRGVGPHAPSVEGISPLGAARAAAA